MLTDVIAHAAVEAGVLTAESVDGYTDDTPRAVYARILRDTERRNVCRGPRTSREYQLLRILSDLLAATFIEDLDEVEISSEAVAAVPASMLFKHMAIPLSCTERSLLIATSDPFCRRVAHSVEHACGKTVDLVLAEEAQIESKLRTHLGVGSASVGSLAAAGDTFKSLIEDDADSLLEDATVIKVVNELLIDAIHRGATDIHIEPVRAGFQLQYRIDGMMQPQPVQAEMLRLHEAIVSRLKIMSSLNIAEKRLPQDGKLTTSTEQDDVDVRVSVIPMIFGESVVLRLLARKAMTWSLESLQLPESTHFALKSGIESPHGLILVTGPTGSGKTTTLYHCLGELKERRRHQKIVTIEDPVEYTLPGVHHIQVNDSTGLSFSRALRSVLRHDPDVILIGEIRDPETACVVVQASLTGHAVLATLHTNDSASAFARLVDMGIEPYLVASTVRSVVAQRLVRRICECCDTQSGYEQYSQPTHGCKKCMSSGYYGRLAILEVMAVDDEIRSMCTRAAPSTEIADYAKRRGDLTMKAFGEQLVSAGKTTREELLRVLD